MQVSQELQLLKRNALSSVVKRSGDTLAEIHVEIAVSNIIDQMVEMAAGTPYAFIMRQTGMMAKQGLREAAKKADEYIDKLDYMLSKAEEAYMKLAKAVHDHSVRIATAVPAAAPAAAAAPVARTLKAPVPKEYYNNKEVCRNFVSSRGCTRAGCISAHPPGRGSARLAQVPTK